MTVSNIKSDSGTCLRCVTISATGFCEKDVNGWKLLILMVGAQSILRYSGVKSLK